MTRSELILRLSESNPQLYQRDLEAIVDTIFSTIAEAMAEGRRVELRGFGAFWAKDRSARTARNPRTGESVTVAAKRTPFFKAGKPLKELLNSDIDAQN
ncbi:MAG TPA: HU family DNA-binding protein [Alphaproteobacteria bacterium]|nr:integration host factor subunit beta [Rhodospirillaceae bacterium]HRJ11689.1 HU family DNA-binding protein [Alphaproteobacteria bacterium]